MTTENFELGESSGEVLLTSPAQVDIVLEAMFRQARHSLLVQSARLDFEFLRTQDLLLLLAPLITGALRNQVRILVEDTIHFMNHQPRIIKLARSFSSYVKVRKLPEEYAGKNDFFVVTDRIGYMHRLAGRKIPVRADPCAPAQAKVLRRNFEESWERSENIPELLTVGL